jgi:NADH:ubiquinone oxidoreductase subunit 6 (subunit J)
MTTTLILIALAVLLCSAVALCLRNLIHSALLFVAAWAGVAAFYLWAGAQFAGFAQILVYVGAVSMVVLFAVLLTRQGRHEAWTQASAVRTVWGLSAAFGVCGALIGSVLALGDVPEAATVPVVTVRQIGLMLMGRHAVEVLIVGLVLTVALLGAVVIASVDDTPPEDTP